MEGELYSLSAFLVDGKVLIDFVVEEKCTASEFAVDTSRVVVISDHRINKLRSDVEAIANFLSLQNGLLHTQFILNDEGAWIIEPTLRCPGDLYSHLIEKTTGFNYALAYIMPFLSKNYNKLLDGNVKKRHIIRHTLTSKERIILKSISCSGEFLNTEIFPLQISGSTIHEAPSTRIATIFVEFKTVDDMEKGFESITNREFFQIN